MNYRLAATCMVLDGRLTNVDHSQKGILTKTTLSDLRGGIMWNPAGTAGRHHSTSLFCCSSSLAGGFKLLFRNIWDGWLTEILLGWIMPTCWLMQQLDLYGKRMDDAHQQDPVACRWRRPFWARPGLKGKFKQMRSLAS